MVIAALQAAIASCDAKVDEALRRIAALQQPAIFSPADVRQHEAWTVPPIMVGVLGAAYYDEAMLVIAAPETLVLAPIRDLHHRMGVRRLSTVISHATGAGNGTFAMALYKLEKPRPSRDIPTALATPLRFQRISPHGQITRLTTTAGRFNVTFDREVTIDPALGLYFVGFRDDSANCEWFCPAGISPGPWTSLSTYPATALPDFPDTVTTPRVAGNFVPSVVLRSTQGVAIYGDPAYDL